MTLLRKSLLSAYGGYIFRSLYLLLLIPFYARQLGPAAYGGLLAALAVQNIVWSVQNWGFSFTGARNIAAAGDGADRAAEFARQATARLLVTPLAVAAGTVAVALSPLLVAQPGVAALAVLCGVISGFNVGWYFQGRMDFLSPVLIEGLGCVITLALTMLLVHGPGDAVWAVAALLLSGLVCLLVAYHRVAAQLPLRLAPAGAAMQLIRESAPLFVSGCGATLLTVMGTYALSAFGSASDVAHFGTAEKVVITLLGLLGPVGQVLLAWFSTVAPASRHGEAIAVSAGQAKAIRMVCLVGALATLAAMTVLPPLLGLLLGPRYEAAAQALRLLSPVLLIGAFNSAIAVYVLVPARQERLVSRISIVVALAAVPVFALAAWQGGAVGVAAARVLMELAIALAYLLRLGPALLRGRSKPVIGAS